MSFEDKQYVCSDCWITARDAERKRIIKLIPEYMATVLSWGHETASKELIALIKGQDK